ncbi:hypothetical protein M2280_004365 [Prescottella agglutinans]|uniref:Uncharacterized protein n=1 Tax=Prescottella agglutinans TaxID=1644129 RepID=A0ABT6MFN4_9NOCA|nr:hypothetical protein [Prescottella agglutinans]
MAGKTVEEADQLRPGPGPAEVIQQVPALSEEVTFNFCPVTLDEGYEADSPPGR